MADAVLVAWFGYIALTIPACLPDRTAAPSSLLLPLSPRQACFRLFRTMKDVFLPSDQDWLNTRFRIAAKKRWHFLECNCGFDQLRDLNIPPPPGPGPARGAPG